MRSVGAMSWIFEDRGDRLLAGIFIPDVGMEMVPRAWPLALVAALLCATPLAAAPAPAPAPGKVDWAKAKRVDVVMLEYKFVPNHLSFRRGIAYRLRLENQGKELHEFTAPEFFAAITLRDPKVLWTGGQEVVVDPGATVDVDLVPLRPGHYDLRCEDHDWAGMTGEIDVQ
jgi:plastocyanin